MAIGISSNQLSGQKFGRRIRRNVLSDCIGDRQSFQRAIKFLEQLYNKLPKASQSKRVLSTFQGICLKTQLSGGSYDLWCGTPYDLIVSDRVEADIVSVIHVSYSLSVTFSVFIDFDNHLPIKRERNQTSIN